MHAEIHAIVGFLYNATNLANLRVLIICNRGTRIATAVRRSRIGF